MWRVRPGYVLPIWRHMFSVLKPAAGPACLPLMDRAQTMYPKTMGRLGRHLHPAAQYVNDMGESVITADVAREDHIRYADHFRCRLDRSQHRHQAGQHLTDHLSAADLQATHGCVV